MTISWKTFGTDRIHTQLPVDNQTTVEVVGGGETAGGGEGFQFASWSETLSLADFQTNTGSTVLQYINFNDPSTVTLEESSDQVNTVEDKTANNHDVLGGNSNIKLEVRSSRNVLSLNGTMGATCNSVGTALAGNIFAKPFWVAIVIELVRAPSALATLWSISETTGNAFRTIDLTTDRYVQYTYASDSESGVTTETRTSTVQVQFDTPTIILLKHERDRDVLYVHDGSTHEIVRALTGEGGTNKGSTTTLGTIGAKGSAQPFDGYVHGVMVAEGIFNNTFTLMENLANVWNINYNDPNISTLDSDVSFHMCMAAPLGDRVDIVSGDVFTMTGTVAQQAGVFTHAADTASTPDNYLQTTIPDAMNLTNKNTYTLFIRFQPDNNTNTQEFFSLNEGSDQAFFLRRQNSTNGSVLRVQSYDSVGGGVFNGSGPLDTANATLLAQWNHVFIWCNGLGLSMQLNDGAIVSATRAALWDAKGTGNYMRVGRGDFFGFDGEIDEITLWDRELTSDERAEVVNGGSYRLWPYEYSTSGNGGDGGSVSNPVDAPYWGTQTGGRTIGNAELTSRMDFVNFKAPVDGDLVSVYMWWKTDNSRGYSDGNRGSYECRIKASNGASPDPVATGAALRTYTENNFLDNNSADNLRTSAISPALPVTKGTQYHLEICNTATDPGNNHASINCITAEVGNGEGLTKPTSTFKDHGCMHLEGWGFNCTFEYAPNNGSYKERMPTIVFGFDTTANGQADTYMGAPYWDCVHINHGSLKPQPITSTTWMRIKMPVHAGFTPQLDRVALAAVRTAGSGVMTCEVTDVSGTVLTSGNIGSGSFPFTSTTDNQSPGWASTSLAPLITLTASTDYYLQFRAAAGTTYYPNMLIDATQFFEAPEGMNGQFGGWYGHTVKAEVSFDSGNNWQNYYLTGSQYNSPSTTQTFHPAFYFTVS